VSVPTVLTGKIKKQHELTTIKIALAPFKFHHSRYIYFNTLTPHTLTAVVHAIIWHLWYNIANTILYIWLNNTSFIVYLYRIAIATERSGRLDASSGLWIERDVGPVCEPHILTADYQSAPYAFTVQSQVTFNLMRFQHFQHSHRIRHGGRRDLGKSHTLSST